MHQVLEKPFHPYTQALLDSISEPDINNIHTEKNIRIKNINGPTGVRGRNSDNKLIQEKLNWSPTIPLKHGLEKTYDWIKKMVNA